MLVSLPKIIPRAIILCQSENRSLFAERSFCLVWRGPGLISHRDLFPNSSHSLSFCLCSAGRGGWGVGGTRKLIGNSIIEKNPKSTRKCHFYENSIFGWFFGFCFLLVSPIELILFPLGLYFSPDRF